MQEFKQIILGEGSAWAFLAYLLLSLFGIYVSLLMHTTKRDPNSPHTPFRFSFAFLFSDNFKRIMLSFCLVLIALRFTEEVLHIPLNAFIALGIGIGFDKLSQIVKDKTNLLDVKKTSGNP